MEARPLSRTRLGSQPGILLEPGARPWTRSEEVSSGSNSALPGSCCGPVQEARRPRRLPRVALRLAVSVGVGLLLLELSLRFLLFAELASGWELSRRFRRPELYASSLSQDYWKLDIEFSWAGQRDGHPCFDWRFGWTSSE